MTVVYVREQGATIRKSGERLRVTQQQRNLFDIPLANLEQLILLGNVQITTPAATCSCASRWTWSSWANMAAIAGD